METKNSYSAMGLRKGASEEEVKKAYVDLVKRFDPEKHTDRFMVIQSSYEVLRDPAKRAHEDILIFNPIKGRFLFTAEEQTNEPDVVVNQKVKELEQAVGKNANDYESRNNFMHALMMRSFKKVRKRLWAEAIEDWEKVLEADPTHQRAKNNLLYSLIQLGCSYADHGLDNEALELWGKALHMNPDDENLIHNLAIASEQAGKTEQAKKYWGETLKRWQAKIDRDPDDTYTKNCIIEVRRHHGGQPLEIERESGAVSIEEYREILKLNPDDFDAQYKISTSYMEEHSWPEAIAALKKLLVKFPKNIEVLNLLGWAFLNSGHIGESFQTWNRSLAIDPKNYSTREAMIKGRMSMGRAFRNKGMHTQALVHFKALIRFTPKSPEVHMEIGQTYMLKGDKRSAAMAFRKVLSLDPKNKMAKQSLSDMKLRV